MTCNCFDSLMTTQSCFNNQYLIYIKRKKRYIDDSSFCQYISTICYVCRISQIIEKYRETLDLPVIKQTDNLLETSVFNVPQVRCYFTIQEL